MSIGSHYAAHTLGALKSTIKQEMDISNRQYGVLQSSVSVVNTIIPVLGGILIDAMGTGIGSLATTFLIVTGNALTSLSTHSNSFGLMVLGRVIYGLGSGTVTTAQETILGHWFMGRGLAITLAFQLASSRLASFLSMSTTVPIMRFFDNFYGAAFWAATFVCFLSFLSNLGYVALLKHIERTQAANEGAVTAEERARRLAVMKRKKRFDFRQMTILPFLAWTIIIQSFIIGSGCTTYLHILPELIKLRFGVSEEVASWEASMSQTIPIITMPFLGILLDKYGRRCTMIVLSAVLFTVSVSLLGFTDMQPIIGSLIFSFALTLGPLSEVSAIPLVVHPGALGTAYGLFKSAQNIGNTWVDVIIGHLQDIKEKK
ncbi:MFS general substrate transporter, partial [Ramicandelaber brevisporus]